LLCRQWSIPKSPSAASGKILTVIAGQHYLDKYLKIEQANTMTQELLYNIPQWIIGIMALALLIISEEIGY